LGDLLFLKLGLSDLLGLNPVFLGLLRDLCGDIFLFLERSSRVGLDLFNDLDLELRRFLGDLPRRFKFSILGLTDLLGLIDLRRDAWIGLVSRKLCCLVRGENDFLIDGDFELLLRFEERFGLFRFRYDFSLVGGGEGEFFLEDKDLLLRLWSRSELLRVRVEVSFLWLVRDFSGDLRDRRGGLLDFDFFNARKILGALPPKPSFDLLLFLFDIGLLLLLGLTAFRGLLLGLSLFLS